MPATLEKHLGRHIVTEGWGAPHIAGSRIKIKHIAAEVQSGLSSAEELLEAHPHLTLGQIHAALSYYYDHQAETDEQVRADHEESHRLWLASRSVPHPPKLRAALERRARPERETTDG